ncbi:hypothetical protein [Sorangium sp. So ce542]|uniref:hypothetical protein n=1 Tax=Sorangium sp. So ce542 TaxID=3133316 RepID=UPI003F626C1D
MAHDGTFASFLARSLDLIERELPWAYEAMSRALAPREVLIEVDGERVGVACARGAVRVEGAARAPAVECRTTRRAILELIDARSTLLDAVVSDAVSLRGSVDDLLAFHDGLMIYLGGAVRSPSFPWLLKEFRIDASARKQ